MPVRNEGFISNLMSASHKRNSKRGSRATSAPAWKSKLINPETEEDEKFGPTRFRREHTSIWDDTLPAKRHTRRLSSSKVGLSGCSPTYAEFRPTERDLEQKRKDEITMKLELGNVEELWKIYVESSAWHQDEGAKWPVLNEEFVKVRKKISALLKRKMRNALESDLPEDLEAALRAADGKVQILSVQGNERFPELDKVFERIEAKAEEKKVAMKGLQASSAPTMSFDEKDEARKGLDSAVESADIDEICTAIQKAMEGGIDVTDAAKHVGITSKYFAPEEERSKGLFASGCFAGEGRQVNIVNMGPEMDLNLLERLLLVAGVKMKYHTDPDEVMIGKEMRKSGTRKGTSIAASLAGKEMKFESEVLKSPKQNTIVFISGPEPARMEGDTATLQKLLKFNKEGGGVMIIGSGKRGGETFPLIRDANMIMQVLNLDKMWGHESGAKVLGKQPEPGKPGFNAAHATFTEMTQLDEGFSITGLDDQNLKKGFREILRGSHGKLLTCIRDPSLSFAGEEGAGPICIHGSPVQLLCGKESVGLETWIQNLMLYMCLRKDDVEEVYIP